MEKHNAERGAEPEVMRDIARPEVQRDCLLSQEPKILESVGLLAARIKAIPLDPKHPELEPRALIVGGFVRDALFGQHPKDADVEVYGLDPERLETVVDQYFPGKVDKVGRAFGILKIFVGEGLDFDVSIPRRESKTGSGHQGFVVQGDPTMSIKEAARRRDFSFNALAADPLTGEVYDYFKGVEDIQQRVLRVTDPERFQDDPLRIYRGMQFAGRMQLRAEPQTLALMKEMVDRGDLKELSPERITEEWKKLLLKSEKPSYGLTLVRQLGIFEKHYPELAGRLGVDEAVDAAAQIIRQKERGFLESEKLAIGLGVMGKDVKPEQMKKVLGRLKFGEDVVKGVLAVAGEFGAADALYAALKSESAAGGAMTEKQYVNATRLVLKRIHPVSWKVLAAASEALFRAKVTTEAGAAGAYEAGEMFARVIKEHGLDAAANQPLIGGKDIMEIAQELGMKVAAGKQFGELIKKVEGARDAGEIVTREEGLEVLKGLLKK